MECVHTQLLTITLAFSAVVGYKFKSKIRTKGRNVKPRKTDSIVVISGDKRKVGYPIKDQKCWMWECSGGNVPLYAASPNHTNWYTRYKLKQHSSFQVLPTYLAYTQTSQNVADTNQVAIDSSIYGIIATEPVLFFEYRYDPINVIVRFNRKDSIPPFDLRYGKEKIHIYEKAFYTFPTDTINYQVISSLLEVDSTSQMGLVGKLLRQLHNSDLTQAFSTLKVIEQNYKQDKVSNSYFLVAYARGQFFLAKEDYYSAEKAFKDLKEDLVKPFSRFGKAKHKEVKRIMRKKKYM